MHHGGHRNQRLARELRAKSRTEVKQHRGQQQQQEQQQESDGVQGEGGVGEGFRQQGGHTESHPQVSAHKALASQSSPQLPTSPEQRHAGRSKKQQQQERRAAEDERGSPHAPHSRGTDGGEDGSQQQGLQNGHTQPHQSPQKQQQHHHHHHQASQKQQQGEGEQVLVGADAAQLLRSGHMALGVGGGAFGQGKPAGVQAWSDVDPQVAQQQADVLGSRQQHKRSSRVCALPPAVNAHKGRPRCLLGGLYRTVSPHAAHCVPLEHAQEEVHCTHLHERRTLKSAAHR
eukprot:1134734-Pelagomonas_calceolata.AAC.4